MPHSGKCDSGKKFLEPLAWEGRCGKCRMAYAQRETCPCTYAVLPTGVLKYILEILNTLSNK